MPEELLPQVKGQVNAMRFLEASLKNGRIGHSYIFVGPPGVGKKSTAIRFVAGILCQQPNEGRACETCSSCKRLAKGSYPYLQLISPEKEKIKIDQIRGINDFLKYKVEESVYRFIIIDEADSMTPEAANSLLKILEEPPARTTFILLVDNLSKVFPTIISRCQLVNFTHLSRDIILEILLDKGFKEEEIQGVLPVAQGSAERALELIQDETLKETRGRIISFVTNLPVPVSRALEFAKECSESDIALCLNIMMSCYRDLLILDSGNDNMVINRELAGLFGPELCRESIFSSIEYIMEAQQAAGQNANKQLVLENLFLELNVQAS